MNVIKWTEIVLFSCLMALTGFGASMASADDSVKEDMKEVGRDIGKNAKKTARSAKDKSCEWVKGKLECAGDKVKHKVQNATDEVKDKADDMN